MQFRKSPTNQTNKQQQIATKETNKQAIVTRQQQNKKMCHASHQNTLYSQEFELTVEMHEPKE